MEHGAAVEVTKLTYQGRERVRYRGELVAQEGTEVVILAPWTHGPYDLGYVTFEPGDLFEEYYASDRWYTIFEIRRADGALKGWYCDICQPPRIGPGTICFQDLILDVWVDARGQALVLDEAEFAAAPLDPATRAAAERGLADLLARVAAGAHPFEREQWR